MGAAISPGDSVAGRHLIQQRLKDVMIATVEQRHLQIGVPQCFCG
jgi:hypothetical protein